MNIKATQVFADIDDTINEGYRYIFLRGSTRSGKSIASLQYIIVECLKTPNTNATIARATAVSLKNTIIVDFKEIMESMDLWDKGTFNKVDNTFIFPNESIIRFVGMDDTTSRLKGMKSDIVMIDEINSVELSSFEQINIRTQKWLLLPYNPELTPDHWILKYEERDDSKLLISNWRQNPFLDERTKKAIMDLKLTDPDLYEIYSEGRIVEPKEKILPPIKTYKELPKNIRYTYYGIDWGYSIDPTAVIKVSVLDKDLYVEEILYEKGLTNEDLIFILKEKGFNRDMDIVGDSSEPKTIETFKRGGLRVVPIKKGSGSVLYGIQKMKTYNIHINETSTNIINEWNNYKFKRDRSGNLTNQMVGSDHALDSLRYVVLNYLDTKPKGKIKIL